MPHLRFFGFALLSAVGVLVISRPASAETGFAWACDPTASSYNAVTTCAPYAYNSRGGAVNVTRNGTGNYTVNFVGLGGRTTAGGHVQITAYGSGNEVCKVVSWGSGGADFAVNVRCFFASNGANTDTRFDILVGWFGQ